MKPSVYAPVAALLAAAVSLGYVAASGLPWGVKWVGGFGVLVYWWRWWRRQHKYQWCLMYPDRVVLGGPQGTQAIPSYQMSEWGPCMVVGPVSLWRDQLPSDAWRYLRVLARWGAKGKE